MEQGKAMGPPAPRRPPPPKFGEHAGAPSAAEPQPGSAEPKAEPAAAAAANRGAPGGGRPPPPKFEQPAEAGAAAAGAAGEQDAGGRDGAGSAADAERAGKARVAAAAAAAAAKYATPAQKERMMMEAAAAAMAAREQEEKRAQQAGRPAEGAAASSQPRGPPPPAASYTPPEWGGAPNGIPYQMEVMKGGAILGTLDLSAQPAYTFGRAPTNDVVLEHPSSSRLHGVVQFRGEDGAAFLFDPGSTHGVQLNKKRIPPKKFIPLRVGDIVRFGESSRLYVFGGPQDMMPEEGPSREQRRQAAALEVLAARKEREAAVAKAQMDAALSGGASWGMAEDAYDPDADVEEVDWRAYSATKGLTEKQQKLADKIRKRELRVQHLQSEVEKIKSKQLAMEDLSAGQASTIVRNEQEIDRSMEEMEELEEQLCDSIRDSIGAKKREAEAKGAVKKRRRANSDDEYDGSSDDDSFYDRTAKPAGGAARKRAGRASGAGGKAQEEAVDAASLYGKREALLEEKKKLEERLREEEEAQRAQQAAAGAGAGAAPAAAAQAEPAAGGAAEGEEVDALDAFMTGVVEAQIEKDRVGSLRREIAEVEAQLACTERLLAIADPDGYFKPGSKAAMAAVERAKRGLEVEKQRRAAEEKQKREREEAKKKQGEAFVPEEEEEGEGAPAAEPAAAADQAQQAQREQQQQQPSAAAAAAAASVHRLEAEGDEAGGLQVRKRPATEPSAQGGEQQGEQQQPSAYQARRAQIAAALAAQKAAVGGSGGGGGEAAGQPAGGVGHNKDVAAAAQARVLADLAVLSQAHRGVQEEEEAVEDFDTPEAAAAAAAAYAASRGRKLESADWRPPAGQSGDGRSALNDKLGY